MVLVLQIKLIGLNTTLLETATLPGLAYGAYFTPCILQPIDSTPQITLRMMVLERGALEILLLESGSWAEQDID